MKNLHGPSGRSANLGYEHDVLGCGCVVAVSIFLISKAIKQNRKFDTDLEQLEKKYDYPAKLFSIFEDNKLVGYRGNLLSRLFPTGLSGLATGEAETLLAMKVETWLAVAVAVLSLAALYIAARSYIRIARKILLGD